MNKILLPFLLLLFLYPMTAEDHMIFVQGGTFQMGSSDGQDDESPVHRVTLRDYYICNHEVTQKEYRALMGGNPSARTRGIGDMFPVNRVSWYEAVEYCNTLSRREGLTPVYSGRPVLITCDLDADGYRLPTEAEWEFAAKGGVLSRSFLYSGSDSLDSVAWYKNTSGSKTHPVKSKDVNELGLYDMTGNVWEWCWDWYGEYSSVTLTNPTGFPLGTSRIFRGGSWSDFSPYMRITNRYGSMPSYKSYDLGFRVVRSFK